MAEILKPHLSKFRIPNGGEKVFKDECVYSFDNPQSETGLYICTNTFIGFGKRFVENYYKSTGNSVFLHLRTIKKKKVQIQSETSEPEKKKVTRMAIGVEGGFDSGVTQFDYEEKQSIVILPDWVVINYPDPTLPDIVQRSVDAILSADSASRVESCMAWEDERPKSKYSEGLVQLDNGKKIPPKGWQCQNCDLTKNLWMNLTDGSILCGRKHWDGTGGNDHAIEYYKATGYPLCVKLGTISSDGADVYSYAEDNMVIDTKLKEHLKHFGINMQQQEKTEKSMAELEIELNERGAEWASMQENDLKLEPIYGPKFTGIHNLGSSCYMNVILQMLFTIPDYCQTFAFRADDIMKNSHFMTATNDFSVQFAKLGKAILSGEYSKPPTDNEDNICFESGIYPRLLRRIIGQNHVEFSTKKQQDAHELLLHLLDLIEKSAKLMKVKNPNDALKFEVQERFQCSITNQVGYRSKHEYVLSLPIPNDGCKKIALTSCLDNWIAVGRVNDFYSTAAKTKTDALYRTNLLSFPDFLVIQIRRFMLADDWTPKKLDVEIDIPDILDLEPYRRPKGLQANETALPERNDDEEQETPAIVLDEDVISQLVEMGFPREACRRAVYNTRNVGGPEAAMEWVMMNVDSPGFSDPFVIPSSSRTKAGCTAKQEDIAMIVSLGFTEKQAIKALKETNNDVERAADFALTNPDQLNDDADDDDDTVRDGGNIYELVGFVSHMGSSTSCGHYVLHAKHDENWYIFNDEKVAKSKQPPKQSAYLYLYRRIN